MEITSFLSPGEEIVLRTKPHKKYAMRQFLIIVLIIYSVILLPCVYVAFIGYPGVLLFVLGILVFSFLLSIMAYSIGQRKIEYLITTQKLYCRWGNGDTIVISLNGLKVLNEEKIYLKNPKAGDIVLKPLYKEVFKKNVLLRPWIADLAMAMKRTRLTAVPNPKEFCDLLLKK